VLWFEIDQIFIGMIAISLAVGLAAVALRHARLAS
jgi:hypothetical protein